MDVRLIDANEVLNKIAEKQDKASTGIEDCALYTAYKIVKDAPTIKAIPINYGYVQVDSEGYERCSICGSHESNMVYFEFCPYCGAELQ